MAFAICQATAWEAMPGKGAVRTARIAKSTAMRLIVVIHSDCLCSEATLENLKSLGEASLARLNPHIVITGPHATAGSESPNVKAAYRLPHASVEFCSEADELARYGGLTSGQCFLYDPSGSLQFSGGITAGRGVPGSSAGMAAIEAALRSETGPQSAPVFGCQLSTPQGGK